MRLIYDQLRELARAYLARERRDHTLRPTDLVHEAYLRLSTRRDGEWRDRQEFFAAAARTIRRVLINHAKARASLKRGGPRPARVPLEDAPLIEPGATTDLLALDEALERLFELDPRQGRIVELKFFGGLTHQEVAGVLDVSPRTVDGEWALARSWLQYEMGGGSDR